MNMKKFKNALEVLDFLEKEITIVVQRNTIIPAKIIWNILDQPISETIVTINNNENGLSIQFCGCNHCNDFIGIVVLHINEHTEITADVVMDEIHRVLPDITVHKDHDHIYARYMGCMSMVVDYEEFKPKTYKGVYLHDGGFKGGEVFRSFTGDFEKDYKIVLKYAHKLSKVNCKTILNNSSVDNWYMDKDMVEVPNEVCPKCGSKDITGNKDEELSKEHKLRMNCFDCENEWIIDWNE